MINNQLIMKTDTWKLELYEKITKNFNRFGYLRYNENEKCFKYPVCDRSHCNMITINEIKNYMMFPK